MGALPITLVLFLKGKSFRARTSSNTDDMR